MSSKIKNDDRNLTILPKLLKSEVKKILIFCLLDTMLREKLIIFRNYAKNF